MGRGAACSDGPAPAVPTCAHRARRAPGGLQLPCHTEKVFRGPEKAGNLPRVTPRVVAGPGPWCLDSAPSLLVTLCRDSLAGPLAALGGCLMLGRGLRVPALCSIRDVRVSHLLYPETCRGPAHSRGALGEDLPCRNEQALGSPWQTPRAQPPSRLSPMCLRLCLHQLRGSP